MDQAGFRLHATGRSAARSRFRSAAVDIRVTGYLERQGASTRVIVDIRLGTLTKFVGAFLLFFLAALALIATVLKAYNVDEFIRISIGLAFLFALVYYLYSSTYADCTSHLAFLIYRLLTVCQGSSENLPLRPDMPTGVGNRRKITFGPREQALVLTWGLLCLGTALYLAISESGTLLLIIFLFFGGLFSYIGVRGIFGQTSGASRLSADEGAGSVPGLNRSDLKAVGDEQDPDGDDERPDWLRHLP
ncbi:MAG: hypothetical protein JXM73_05285 [Anaerolineae bacterium]|nr:hypothetical protein [Anaerolineae bacterium]